MTPTAHIDWSSAPEAMRAAVRAWAARVGVELDETSTKPQYSYDGHRIATDRPVSTVVHDIAHYICASNWRRRMPEFGLGPGPDARDGFARLVTGFRFAEREEARASMLGIMFEYAQGWAARDTLRDHNWIPGVDGGGRLVRKEIRRRNEHLTIEAKP